MKSFEEGEIVSFRRMFKDAFPRIGKILKVGFQSVVVETAERIQLFVPISNVWHRR